MRSRAWRWVIPMLCLIARAGIAQAPGEPSPAPEMRRLLETRPAPGEARRFSAVARFYRARDHAPAWTTAQGWNAAGSQLRAALAQAARDGLEPELYEVPWPAVITARTRVQADLALSLAALRLADHLAGGVVPPGVASRDAGMARPTLSSDSLLDAWSRTTSPAEAFEQLAPQSPVYRALRAMHGRLLQMADQTTPPMLSLGPTLRSGDRGPRVEALRSILRHLGDGPADTLADAGRNDVFDTDLAAAVARLQARHGLLADSMVGQQTLRALRTPVSERQKQAAYAMERLRWLPAVRGDRVLTVNLADYRVALTVGDTVRFNARAVIGTQARPTPLFADTITHVVLNPTWTVPPSIIATEIAPRVRRDPGYLARQHMVRVAGGIEQQPGPWNALGQVAFSFPNAYNVYVHDTPAKSLFDESTRAFSHGCIRIDRPLELAALLLEPGGWSPVMIDSVLATGRRSPVALATPVPVHLTYLTAFMGSDGSMQFRDDIYRRDATLQRAMDAERQRIRQVRAWLLSR